MSEFSYAAQTTVAGERIRNEKIAWGWSHERAKVAAGCFVRNEIEISWTGALYKALLALNNAMLRNFPGWNQSG
jgi:hypothetical protein